MIPWSDFFRYVGQIVILFTVCALLIVVTNSLLVTINNRRKRK